LVPARALLVRPQEKRTLGREVRGELDLWNSPSPKFIMGGSKEEKFDHPTQKPIELMRRPILNHTKVGELVYDPFLGSGTTLAAAEVTQRVCYGLELDPKYADVAVQRWQALSHHARGRRPDVRCGCRRADETGSMSRTMNIGRLSPAFPVTPPGVRVRTGRFGGLSYRLTVNLGIPSESK
jgi:hypothetical protein